MSPPVPKADVLGWPGAHGTRDMLRPMGAICGGYMREGQLVSARPALRTTLAGMPSVRHKPPFG